MSGRSRYLLPVSLALGAVALPRAQMHHVEQADKVTRAVGVYEWTGDLLKPHAARFVPVSLFIDGRYEDAGLYLARPVPFSLGDGYLYTVERSGEPQGVLDLQSAARVVTGKALADDNPTGAWYGYGTFTGAAPAAPPPALHRSAHLGVIQSSGRQDASAPPNEDDGKPHMTRRAGSESDADTASQTGAETSGGGTPRAGSTGGEDTDRPTLARRDPSQDAARRKPAVGGAKANTASVTAVGPQPGDDPDRPTLSRKTEVDNGPQPLTGMPADLHQAVAVSDAKHQETHPFARAWSDDGERSEVLTAMAALARPRLEAYLTENKLVPAASGAAAPPVAAGNGSSEGIAADTSAGSGAPPKLQRGKPTEYGGASASTRGAAPEPATAPSAKPHSTAHSHRPASAVTKKAKPVPAAVLTLLGEQLSGFTLSYGGLPTFVYSATAPARSVAGGSTALPMTVFLTLVAQRLPSGELQVALASVTDSLHLDRSPRFKLIDAVDPDASHRASLLFELQASNSRQFALYRLVTARAENTFTSALKE